MYAFLLTILFASAVYADDAKLSSKTTKDVSRPVLTQNDVDFYKKSAADIAHINKLYGEKKWKSFLACESAFRKKYPKLINSFIKDIDFYRGIAFFNIKDYEMANDCLNLYLQQLNAKFFDEAVSCKFNLAEKLRRGARVRLFKWQKSPIYLSGVNLAIKVYKEVIDLLSDDDYVVRSWYGIASARHAKGQYFDNKDREGAITIFQRVIKNYPTSDVVPKSFFHIGQICLEQAKTSQLDDYFLYLSEKNRDAFKRLFPNDKQGLDILNQYIISTSECYASQLLYIARFYERINAKESAKVYYETINKKYPNTPSASIAQKRLADL